MLPRLPMLSLCCAVAVVLLQQQSEAKPYNKKPYHKADFPQSPFAPPAFYDDGSDYDFKDNKWMSWTPLGNNKAAMVTKKPSTETNSLPKQQPKPKDTTKAPVDAGSVPTKKEAPKFEDPCKNVYCKYGRVCQADKLHKARCVCAGADFCRGHAKQVCGTDGVLYPSHCELHRTACIRDQHIGIDHSGTKCAPPPTQPAANAGDKTKDKKTKSYKPSITATRQNKDTVAKAANYNTIDDNTKQELSKFPSKPDKYDPADYPEEGNSDLEDDQEQFQPLGSKVNAGPKVEKKVEDYKPEIRTPCEELEYERLKNNLVQYHCARIGEMDCTTDPAKKQFVANIMFNYYDQNSDQRLTEEEMLDIEHRDHLEKLSRFCRLADLLTFNDREGDGNISLTEFYSALKIPTVALDETLKVFTSMVTTGNSVELKCDIQGAVEIVWKRNGALLDDLVDDEMQVFEDGSLYLKEISLHDIGNYTCQDRYEDQVKQTHVLKVQMSPRVRVSPSTQFHTSGASVSLRCHADGVPQPQISWEMNEAPLPQDTQSRHYVLLHNNATLEIQKATYTKDTGAYKCRARNSAGAADDIATVFIENSKVPQYSDSGALREVFIVFHDAGLTVYEPNHCHLEHQVSAAYSHFSYLPDVEGYVPRLCAPGQACSWGSAVKVANKYVYVSQPELSRVIVVEIKERTNPVEIIQTDKYPVKLHYVEHLDQVWVLCWGQEDDTGAKTAVVIRQASEDIQHHTIHMQPVGNRFDLINDFFLAPSNDLGHTFDYGYAMHRDQQGLYKMDLRAMTYVNNIDLRPYSCVPKSVAFLPMGGKVIVHCVSPLGQPDQSTRLTLDYLTDHVLDHSALGGQPHLSPDARTLVTVETDGNTISVSNVHDDGSLEHVFDEYTNLHISSVAFFPSARGHGYDFYASATNNNDVLYIDLSTGKVQMIQGVGPAMPPSAWPWSPQTRSLVSGGMFGGYLMSPAQDAVVVIDGGRRAVQCEWQNIHRGNVIVWVDPMHL